MEVKAGDTVYLVRSNGTVMRLPRKVLRVTRAGTIIIQYISGEWWFHKDGLFKKRNRTGPISKQNLSIVGITTDRPKTR